MDLRGLTDDDLLRRLEALACGEREVLGDVIECLMEVDRREIVTDRGYESTFVFCVRRLRYSEPAAFGRIRAARAAARFPEILPRLRSGELSLDAVVRLYPHLTDDNKAVVIEKASNAPKTAVLALVADLKGPQAREPDKVQILARPAAETGPLFAAATAQPAEIIPPPRRVRLEFEADEALLAKVDRLKSLLRSKYPFARLEEVFSDAAEALLDRVDPDRKHRTQTKCVRTQLVSARRAAKRNRWVPAAVKRLVWQRDGGRCAFVAPDGRRCESRDALQYDHVTPYALGGASDDPANIRLLCRPHNQRLARRRFGPRPRKGA